MQAYGLGLSPQAVTALAFAEGGRLLVSAGGDTLVAVWQLLDVLDAPASPAPPAPLFSWYGCGGNTTCAAYVFRVSGVGILGPASPMPPAPLFSWYGCMACGSAARAATALVITCCVCTIYHISLLCWMRALRRPPPFSWSGLVGGCGNACAAAPLAQQVDMESSAAEFGTLWLRPCISKAPDGVLSQALRAPGMFAIPRTFHRHAIIWRASNNEWAWHFCDALLRPAGRRTRCRWRASGAARAWQPRWGWTAAAGCGAWPQARAAPAARARELLVPACDVNALSCNCLSSVS